MTTKTKVATPVVKNKFWVVEEEGKQVATIQAIDGGGVAYVKDHSRKHFVNLSELKKQYNIVIGKKADKGTAPTELYGYPVEGKPHNISYNVQSGIPVYSKTAASKSMFCAGYYCIELDPDNWISHFCPKLITVKRYPYMGPFKTESEMLQAWEKSQQN